ncbi:MAG: HD-GYP domain-containing protein [Candidatus Limnocylindrales bacterium]
MSRSLKLLLMAVITTAIIVVFLAVTLFTLPPGFGGWAGVAYWTALVLFAQAFPVKMPRGTIVSVAIAPLLAASVIGGPTAAAIVAAIGMTELRELRGQVPWYGTLYNHAAIVIAAVLAAVTVRGLTGPDLEPTWTSLLAVGLGGASLFVANATLVYLAVVTRDRVSPGAVLAGDLRLISGNLLGMTPLAWLMAVVWSVAWWAVPLFALPLYANRAAYQAAVQIREMFTQTVRALASAVDARDPYTAKHSENVQTIAVDIGRVMRCNEAEMEALEWGGLLHDIGKIGVRDEVLLKQDKLTREERILMNAHPVLGEEIIKPVARLAPELPIIRHHHEWYNGSGYPDHLMGEEIPKLARILHVADAFEAMTAKRPYRMRPLSREQALAELRKYAGIQFDPEVLDAFARTSWVAGVADPGKPVPRTPALPLMARFAGRTSSRDQAGDQPVADAP